MPELSTRNFGLLIAYVLPGFVTLWGASLVSPAVAVWLLGTTAAGPNVGGFLYVAIGSVAAGMTVSAVRWAVVDGLHAATGLRRPAWDDSKLQERLPAFEALVENHYRYYQFYSNMLVALLLAYPLWRLRVHTGLSLLTDIGFLLIEGVFLAASRDALRRYFQRSAVLLGIQERKLGHDQRTRQRRRGIPEEDGVKPANGCGTCQRATGAGRAEAGREPEGGGTPGRRPRSAVRSIDEDRGGG